MRLDPLAAPAARQAELTQSCGQELPKVIDALPGKFFADYAEANRPRS